MAEWYKQQQVEKILLDFWILELSLTSGAAEAVSHLSTPQQKSH